MRMNILLGKIPLRKFDKLMCLLISIFQLMRIRASIPIVLPRNSAAALHYIIFTLNQNGEAPDYYQ